MSNWFIGRPNTLTHSPPPGVRLPWWERTRPRRAFSHVGRAGQIIAHNPRYLTVMALLLLTAILQPSIGPWSLVLAVGIGIIALGLWVVYRPHSVKQAAYGWYRSNRRYRWTWNRTLRRCHAAQLDVPVPLLLRVRSTTQHRLPIVDKLRVKIPTGLDPTTFQDYRGELLQWGWRGLSTRVYNPNSASHTVELWNLINDPLIEPVQPYPQPTEPLPKEGLALAKIEDGEPWHLKLRGGAANCFVCGVSGAGKGSVIGSLLEKLQLGIDQKLVEVWGIDPQASELGMWRHLFAKLVYTQQDAADMLEALVAIMDERTHSMFGITRQHTPSTKERFIVLVADEGLDLLDKTDRPTYRRIMVALGRLLRQDRKASIMVMFLAQRAELDIVEFRKDFNQFIALKLATENDVNMVLGRGALQSGAKAHEITQPGVAYVASEEGIVRVRFPYLTDDHIRDLPPAPGNEREEDQPAAPQPASSGFGGFA